MLLNATSPAFIAILYSVKADTCLSAQINSIKKEIAKKNKNILVIQCEIDSPFTFTIDQKQMELI